MEERALERYRQRYETWRHLDRVRYQIIQFAIAALAAFALFVQGTNGSIHPLALISLSLIFFFLSKVLSKVNDGIAVNGSALRDYGLEVGDERIPVVSDRKSSIFYYTEWALLFCSALVFFWGVVAAIMSLA
jgi:hypothetical protein